jgi:ABC-type nitrate/sulfonate/bicarbonate transport system substrate-binding protein
VRALLRGQQFIWSNPAEAAQIAAAALKSDAALAGRSLAEAIRLGILDPRLNWSEVGLQRIYENMQADGTIPVDRKFDLGQITDAGYLRAAQGGVPALAK